MDFEEFNFGNGEVEIQTTLWYGNLNNEWSLKQRIMAAIFIMWNGRTVLYDFVFEPEAMYKLRDWLNESVCSS